MTNADVRLVDIEVVTLRNAIPREDIAKIYIADGKEDEAKKVFEEVTSAIKAEYAGTDPDMEFILEPYRETEGEVCDPEDCLYVAEEDAVRLIRAVIACPDGVERMSSEIPGLVETSNNMAMVRIEKGRFEVKSLLRSSVDSAKDALAEKIACVFALAGTDTSFTGGYSGWAPHSSSAILHTMKDVYRRLYGSEPAVMAIHAGLECGILGGTYPHWDMVSCGPTILSPHSPDERVNIATVGRCWEFVTAVLEAIPEK